MFNKNTDNIKKVDLKFDKLFQDDEVLLSRAFIDMMNTSHNNDMQEEKNEYQSNIISYYNNKKENSIKKQYDPKIEKLYYDGVLAVDSKEYKLKDFFIVYDNKLNNFHLKCIDPSFTYEEIEYNKAVRFIDTTAFINLINKGSIVNNKLIIKSINTIFDTIKDWDGFLHSETLEADSIINKKMIRDDTDE